MLGHIEGNNASWTLIHWWDIDVVNRSEKVWIANAHGTIFSLPNSLLLRPLVRKMTSETSGKCRICDWTPQRKVVMAAKFEAWLYPQAIYFSFPQILFIALGVYMVCPRTCDGINPGQVKQASSIKLTTSRIEAPGALRSCATLQDAFTQSFLHRV